MFGVHEGKGVHDSPRVPANEHDTIDEDIVYVFHVVYCCPPTGSSPSWGQRVETQQRVGSQSTDLID